MPVQSGPLQYDGKPWILLGHGDRGPCLVRLGSCSSFRSSSDFDHLPRLKYMHSLEAGAVALSLDNISAGIGKATVATHYISLNSEKAYRQEQSQVKS